MLAIDHEGVKADILILGKALSGGLMPISCILANDVPIPYLAFYVQPLSLLILAFNGRVYPWFARIDLRWKPSRLCCGHCGSQGLLSFFSLSNVISLIFLIT